MALIRCEAPGRWTIEGKIEHLPGSYGGEGAHVGIEELTTLLCEHVDKWVKVRVEIIEGPNPSEVEAARAWIKAREGRTEERPIASEAPKESNVAEELKRMRAAVERVRKHLGMVRMARGPSIAPTIEEQCIAVLAETLIVVCNHLEAFDRRLQNLEGR